MGGREGHRLLGGYGGGTGGRFWEDEVCRRGLAESYVLAWFGVPVSTAIPAKAEAHYTETEIPAFAGMTWWVGE